MIVAYIYVCILEDVSYIFLLLYMDNMLIVAKSMCEVNRLKSLLYKEFEMKDQGACRHQRISFLPFLSGMGNNLISTSIGEFRIYCNVCDSVRGTRVCVCVCVCK